MERRQFNRVLFQANAVLQQFDKQWPTSLNDLSFKGALIARPENFDGDFSSSFTLSFSLQGVIESVTMQGSISHAEPTQLGFAATQLDIQSATMLRRLIELNIGDEALLNRDLQALINN